MNRTEPSVNAYSAAELAAAVNAWCAEHRVRPLSGQAAASLTERNIHYYRSLGLVTAPNRGRGAGYGEKQFLQLVAVRLLQARGMPHRRIHELLYGRSIADLREVRDRGLAELPAQPTDTRNEFLSPETWNTIPLGDDYLLINRSGKPVDPCQLEQIRAILDGPTTDTNRLKRKEIT